MVLLKSRPVHSLVLSSHLFLCPPLLPPPGTVPCEMVLRDLIHFWYTLKNLFSWSFSWALRGGCCWKIGWNYDSRVSAVNCEPCRWNQPWKLVYFVRWWRDNFPGPTLANLAVLGVIFLEWDFHPKVIGYPTKNWKENESWIAKLHFDMWLDHLKELWVFFF